MSSRANVLRIAVLGASAALVAVGVMVACSGPAGTPYGNPNTLDRKNIPGEGGVEPLSCGGGEGGASSSGGGAGGACAMSFSKDIFPYFADAGGCSLPACHAAGKVQPPIDTTSPDKLYASLKAAEAAKLPYLPPGDGGTASDGGGTSLICNLRGECGSKMPKGEGKDPTNDDLCKMQAWIACGAPNN